MKKLLILSFAFVACSFGSVMAQNISSPKTDKTRTEQKTEKPQPTDARPGSEAPSKPQVEPQSKSKTKANGKAKSKSKSKKGRENGEARSERKGDNGKHKGHHKDHKGKGKAKGHQKGDDQDMGGEARPKNKSSKKSGTDKKAPTTQEPQKQRGN